MHGASALKERFGLRVTVMNDRRPARGQPPLSCWSGPVTPEPLKGGITNANFVVSDRGRRHFVRIGDDILVHGILRFHELAASRRGRRRWTLARCPSPRTRRRRVRVRRRQDALQPAMSRQPTNLRHILPLLQRCHREMPRHFRGPALIFWVFQIFRDYAQTLADSGSRMVSELPRLLGVGADLEAMVGPSMSSSATMICCPANFIDDGQRLWLIDWDYAGFNSPLFDLGNLCSNNEVAEADEKDGCSKPISKHADGRSVRAATQAMKCASLLRETMWSMVSEHHSTL